MREIIKNRNIEIEGRTVFSTFFNFKIRQAIFLPKMKNEIYEAYPEGKCTELLTAGGNLFST